jgi:hypothetical protein
MVQADSKNSITAPVISTRRRFLTTAAGASVISVGSLAAGAIRVPTVSCVAVPSFLSVMSDLTPQDVLADLLGSADFPAEVIDPARASDVIIERLRDAGFNIVPTTQGDRA